MDEIIKKDLTQILGVDELPEAEQEAFMAEVGNVVLQTALVRFSATLDDGQREALDHFLETEPAPEDLFKHLADNYESFNNILEEAVAEFKADAVSVMREVK